MEVIFFVAFAFIAGLICGWIVLPEPAWARRLFIKWGWAKPTEP